MKTQSASLGMILMLAMIATLLTGAISQAYWANWTNADPDDSLWSTAGNWENDIIPDRNDSDAPDDPYINKTGEQRPILDYNAPEVRTMRVGTHDEDNAPGELKIVEGADLLTWRINVGYVQIGAIEQTGGDVEVTDWMSLGEGGAGHGTWELKGGTLSLTGSRNDTLILETSEFEVSGGSLYNRRGVGLRDSGATFRVKGSGDNTISLGQVEDPEAYTDAGYWNQVSGTTLAFEIDEGGVTPIKIFNGGEVTFADGALLDVGWVDGVKNFGTWDVMTWEDGTAVNDHGLSFVENGVDTDIWSFDIDEENNKMTVTAIPEPSSLVLLGIAGLLLMKRRRV